MSELMEQVRIWIDAIITALGYVGIALVMFAENIFPPIPSELVMPFAGFKVAEGEYNFIATVLAGTLGSVAGAIVLYYVGMWSDEVIVRRFVRRYGRFFLLSESDLDRTLGFFQRYGDAVIFFGRVIPIVRSLISIPAGMNRMAMGRFLFFTTLGSAIWSTILTYSGVLLGQNWQDVLGIVKQYERVVLALIVVGVVAFVVMRVMKWRQRGTIQPMRDDKI